MRIVILGGGILWRHQHLERNLAEALTAVGHECYVLCPDCIRVLGANALRELKADCALTVHGRSHDRELLSAPMPGVRCRLLWVTDDPHEVDLSEQVSGHFDLVLTTERNTCGVHGPHKTWYMPLSAPPGRPIDPPLHDVCWVGWLKRERRPLIEQAWSLASDLRWCICGPGDGAPLAGMPWNRKPVSARRFRQLAGQSRIVLDVPRDHYVSAQGQTNRRLIPATGVGLRPFESLALGRCLLTDDSRADMRTLFPEGSYATYRRGDPVDLAQRLRELLEGDAAEEIGAAGHAAFLKAHAWPQRARQVAEVVQGWLSTRPAAAPRPGAPARRPSPAVQRIRDRRRAAAPVRPQQPGGRNT